jgi:cytochrome c-type biogenesis protein CcmH
VIARAAIAALAALLLAGAAAATKMDPVPPSGDNATGMTALDVRLKRLETELRCLVCQNQTLADSNADLADDLRHEVRALALAGKSDDDIKSYLVARYGDFVLYKPPVKPTTWMLWFGPFALLAGGGAIGWVVLRRRARAATAGDAAGEARARALLDDGDQARGSGP